MIWLLGKSGMLGNHLCIELAYSGLEHVSTGREYDITKLDEIREFADDKKFNWIINCTGYTDVDKAESEPQKCFDINSIGAENLAKLAKEIDAKLIHFSSNYIFTGDSQIPYKETDLPSPISTYGSSKLEAELAVKDITDRHFIIRSSWMYGLSGSNFVINMIKMFTEKEELKIISDSIGSPTFAKNLAENIAHLISDGSEKYGTYHYSDQGETSWYKFAEKIAELAIEYKIIDKIPKIIPVLSKEFRTKAKRPEYAVLNTYKIRKELNFPIKPWEVNLRRFFQITTGE